MNGLGFFFRLLLIVLLTSCKNDRSQAQNVDVESNRAVSYEVVVEDLDIPWGFVFLPDGSLLIRKFPMLI